MESSRGVISHNTIIKGEGIIMYRLTLIRGLIKRGTLPAVAIAMLLFLASGFRQAQAQEIRFNAFEPSFRGGVSVGVAAGQTIRILIEAADASTSSLNKPTGDPGIITGTQVNGHVKVSNASTGALLWSREFTSLTPGLNIFDINRDELPQGNSDVSRLQLWIDVVLVARPTKEGEVGVNLFAPTFEMFGNLNGKTTVRGGLWKTTNFLTADPRGGTITFTGLE